MKAKRPSLFIVGNFFNRHPGKPVTQAEELRKILEKQGFTVYAASPYLKRVPRFFHTLFSMFWYARRYQMVNIQFYGGLALVLEDMASLAAKVLGKMIIFTLHGGAIPDKVRKHPKWYKRVLARGDVITCPSSFLIHHLSHLGLEMQLIENSLPLEGYQFQTKTEFRPRLLWMRSFHPIYHPEMALEVLRLLKPRFPEVCLYMAGVDLGYFDALKKKAIAMELGDAVVFPGFLDLQGKNRMALECDIYLCTNRIDNTPVSLLEMMALGLPVVSTNVGGIPFMVGNGQEAVLVNSGDAPAMADAVEHLIKTPALGRRLVQNGLKLVRKYGEDQVAEKWMALLESLAESKNG